VIGIEKENAIGTEKENARGETGRYFFALAVLAGRSSLAFIDSRKR